jgi:DNA-binding transcriptional LysR family regulator
MKLESLRYFHVTQQCGSIRMAADRLHIAPSAISRQIAILERELKLRLFERNSNGVATTAAGRLLAHHTQSIFRDISRAQSAIDDLKGLQVGEVTVYAMEGLVSDFLPSLLSSFHARFPGISFNLVLAPTDRIIEAVVHDEADIGISFNAKLRHEITVAARYAEPVSCIVSPKHPLAREKSVTLKTLQHYPLALPNDSFGLRQLIDTAVKRRAIDFKTLLTTNSLELTKTLAAKGAAVAFMPAFTVSAEVARGSLRCIPVNDKGFRVPYSEVCIRRNRELSRAAQEFLKVVVAEVKGLKARSPGPF